VQLALNHGVPMSSRAPQRTSRKSPHTPPGPEPPSTWPPTAPSPHSSAKAIETAMTDARYRANARRLQNEYSSHDALAEITGCHKGNYSTDTAARGGSRTPLGMREQRLQPWQDPDRLQGRPHGRPGPG